jgi:serine phosphatase RsbU (regulator of sigma subunit)/pSer/pThr/pTyr-binding forkhead associated (FHA) protein
MAKLVIQVGPDGEVGQEFQLTGACTVIGRQPDVGVCLPPKAVSRQHAQILYHDGNYQVEDLDSANGTFLNGNRLVARHPTPLNGRDHLQIGPYDLTLVLESTPRTSGDSWVIKDEISLVTDRESVYARAPAQTLQVILEISQHLARTLDLDELLAKLFEQLMKLFPQADRCLLLLSRGDHLIVRGQHCRHREEPSAHPFSRTIVHRALREGVGLLSEDAQADLRFDSSATITSLNLRALMCVPLICPDGRRLGAIQVDRFRPGMPFRSEDLQLLTTICLQMAVVLDNAELHAELLREERLRQELALARDIQEGFLPTDFSHLKGGFELFACVHPARVVSGDLYDFCQLPDGRLSFFVGDVSGKGMPAALFMVAVRTLSRHLAASGGSPSQTLLRLNEGLSQANPSGLFVTLAHGIFEPATGDIVFASGGHHLPLIRHGDGRVEELSYRVGRLLGIEGLELRLTDTKFHLDPGETLVFYTDGVTEARPYGSKEMFGLERLRGVVAQMDGGLPLTACANLIRQAVHDFTGQDDLQDDVTVFLLRRNAGVASLP